MKIVASNSDAEVAIHEATLRVEWRLRELTANLLRVLRGAGDPTHIDDQAAALLEAIDRFRSETPPLTPLVLRDLLRLPEVDHPGIVSGALQVAASALLKQPLPERKGVAEMLAGVERAAEHK